MVYYRRATDHPHSRREAIVGAILDPPCNPTEVSEWRSDRVWTTGWGPWGTDQGARTTGHRSPGATEGGTGDTLDAVGLTQVNTRVPGVFGSPS
jgi:hypothetical protein